jgi:exopolysaccharide biosynthesis polyprenyl glycosylphosphotransferase
MIKAFLKSLQFAKLFLGFIDVFSTVLILILSVYLTNKYTSFNVAYGTEEYLTIGILVISWIILLKATHVARIPRASSYSIIFFDFVRLSLVGGLILLTADWLIKIDDFPAFTIALFVVLDTIALFSIRIFTFKFFKIFRASGHNLRNVIILSEDSGEELIEKIYNQKEWGFRIISIITDSEHLRKKFNKKIKIYPSAINIKSIVKYDIIDEIICLDYIKNEQKTYELIDFCNELGVTVRMQSVKRITLPPAFNCRKHYFGKAPLYTIENTPNNSYKYSIKYILEIAIAFSILFVLSPFLLLIAILIALTSNGPVIFKQTRVGLRGRQFYIYKFRTMVSDAEELKARLLQMNESDGPVFKIRNDPRVTKIGRILRKTSIDEIPQLFNVIKGEMSIIGPRPPLQKEVEQYEPWQLKRLSVKPGLTFTWQTAPNRNEVKFENWMEMDIDYIDNWTLTGDLLLFFKTFRILITAKSY